MLHCLQVAINGWHCLALSDTGKLYAWGGNEYNQCNGPPNLRDIVTPIPCMLPFERWQVSEPWPVALDALLLLLLCF